MKPYFAYGSNLEPVQMLHRCPEHRVLGPACLTDWQLLFRGRSERWGGGAVATIEPEPGSRVWGVLFDLSMEDFSSLDRCESHVGHHDPANLYDKISVLVADADGISREAEAYQMIPQDAGSPSRVYLDAIQVGARHHQLPAEYLRMLELIQTL